MLPHCEMKRLHALARRPFESCTGTPGDGLRDIAGSVTSVTVLKYFTR
jgi:hypothetical protein